MHSRSNHEWFHTIGLLQLFHELRHAFCILMKVFGF